jgi:hypothetical protein
VLDERRSRPTHQGTPRVPSAPRNPRSGRDLKTAAPDRPRSGRRPETNSRHPPTGAGTGSPFAAQQVSAELSSGTRSSPRAGHRACLPCGCARARGRSPGCPSGRHPQRSIRQGAGRAPGSGIRPWRKSGQPASACSKRRWLRQSDREPVGCTVIPRERSWPALWV